jgi:hypothetical protein
VFGMIRHTEPLRLAGGGSAAAISL